MLKPCVSFGGLGGGAQVALKLMAAAPPAALRTFLVHRLQVRSTSAHSYLTRDVTDALLASVLSRRRSLSPALHSTPHTTETLSA